MTLSKYYRACLEHAEKQAANTNLDEVTRHGAEREAESCKRELAKIASGEIKDEEI